MTNPARFQKQSVIVLWKLMSPRDNVWNHLYQSIMTIILQANDTIRWYTKLGAQVPSNAASDENPAEVDKEWKKLEAIPAWNLDKMKGKKEVMLETQKVKKKVLFATLMSVCHLKNAELKPKFEKYKGRLVLRGDIVKDDSGAYAVFHDQGSSASQMTAARVMDVIARLADCDGQAADVVSAYTPVKMEDNPRLLRIPRSECPDVWIHLPRHKWPKSWMNIEDRVVPFERHLYGHPLAGLSWERQFEDILSELAWERVQNWECQFVYRKQRLFLSVYVDGHQNGWKES